MTDKLIERLLELMQFGMLAPFGGVANYVYLTVQHGRAFSWIMMMVNMFLAFFVGNMVGSLLPDSQFKDGLLMTAGFCTYPILNIIETQSRRRLGALMDRVINKWIGPVGVDKDTPEA